MSEIWFKSGKRKRAGYRQNLIGNVLVKMSDEDVGIHTIFSTFVYVWNFPKKYVF